MLKLGGSSWECPASFRYRWRFEKGSPGTQTNTITKYDFIIAPTTETKPTGDWSKRVSDPTIHFVNRDSVLRGPFLASRSV